MPFVFTLHFKYVAVSQPICLPVGQLSNPSLACSSILSSWLKIRKAPEAEFSIRSGGIDAEEGFGGPDLVANVN